MRMILLGLNRKWIVLAIGLVFVLVWLISLMGSPAFDADAVAESETRMWQAYYSGDRMQLGLELMELMREQYGFSLFEAKDCALLLARAAVKFQNANSDYERIVLDDLTAAYVCIQKASGGSFDPEAVARAELAWWVARRTPGNDSAEQVGALIADLYRLLYGSDMQAFHDAGVLRAQAAGLRDSGGKNAEWTRIEDLLKESYRKLSGAL